MKRTAALTEEFPPQTSQLTAYYNSSSRESNTLFWPLPAPRTDVVHRQICRQNTHIHKIN